MLNIICSWAKIQQIIFSSVQKALTDWKIIDVFMTQLKNNPVIEFSGWFF